MPYNNTPIEPSKEITGHVSLPLARVQKIIHADPERLNVSKNAAFAIALATEMFIQHLATTTHNVVKTERKPRRNIQYRDVSSAVAKTDNLEFAVDVVPRTMMWKEAKKRREEKEERERVDGVGSGVRGKGKAKAIEATNGNGNGNENGDAANGDDDTEIVEADEASPTQIPDPETMPASAPAKTEAPAPADDAMDVDERVEDSEPEEDPAAMQLEMEMRGPPREKTQSPEQPKTVTTRRSTGGFTAINGSK